MMTIMRDSKGSGVTDPCVMHIPWLEVSLLLGVMLQEQTLLS